MGVPIPVPIRQVIVERHERGQTLETIAHEMGMSFWTVRKIWRRYRDKGEAGLRPEYDMGASREIRSPQLAYRAAVWLKRAHPRWGAGMIRLLIAEKWPELKVPHERTMQRWFVAAGVNRRGKGHITGHKSKRGQAVHEVWQMDAKEQMKLADESQASWLMATDEKSGAIISGQIFPPGEVAESGG